MFGFYLHFTRLLVRQFAFYPLHFTYVHILTVAKFANTLFTHQIFLIFAFYQELNSYAIYQPYRLNESSDSFIRLKTHLFSSSFP